MRTFHLPPKTTRVQKIGHKYTRVVCGGMNDIRLGLSVGAGAALGAGLRVLLTMVFGEGYWPLLFINVLGAFLMGWLRPGAFWGTGVLGGFTSFSAFAVLLVDAPAATTGGYLVATAGGCVGAWLLGDRWERRSEWAR